MLSRISDTFCMYTLLSVSHFVQSKFFQYREWALALPWSGMQTFPQLTLLLSSFVLFLLCSFSPLFSCFLLWHFSAFFFFSPLYDIHYICRNREKEQSTLNWYEAVSTSPPPQPLGGEQWGILTDLTKREKRKWDQAQGITRGLFQLSRRDREFLPFSLMLRNEIENIFPSVSWFETRSRISSLRSHASRRDREFLSFGLVLRDEIEIQLGVSGNTPRRDCGVCLKLLAPWTVVIDWYQLSKFKTQDCFLLLSVL